jgi:hypothetical protein
MSNKYTDEIERIREAAETAQDVVIAKVRVELLIPFCERTGLRFTAGNGTWSFDKRDKYGVQQHYGTDDVDLYRKRGPLLTAFKMPLTLAQFLQENHVGSLNDLGSLMEDYTPANWK